MTGIIGETTGLIRTPLSADSRLKKEKEGLSMKKIAQKLLVLVALLIGTVLVGPQQEAYASTPPAIEGGTITDTIKWSMSPSGIVKISGTGAIPNCKNVGTATEPIYKVPWQHPDQIKKIVVGEGITSIGTYALHASNVEAIELPSTLTSIGKFACFGDTKLTSVSFAGSRLTEVGARAFESCTSLRTISLPDSVSTVGERAFARTGLTSFKVPSGLKTIPQECFRECRSLKTVNLPVTVSRVYKYAFYESGLTTATIRNKSCVIGAHSGTITAKTIYGLAGSTAQKYAKKYGRIFKQIGSSAAAPKVTKVTITKAPKTLKAGRPAILKAKVSGTSKKGVTWKYNKKYAVIVGNVIIPKQAAKGRTITVTAVAKDNAKKKATVKITVPKK